MDIEFGEDTEKLQDTDDIENLPDDTQNTQSSYFSVFYLIIFIIVGLFILWIIISMFSKQPPIDIINQMLNSNLEIPSASDL